IRLYILLLIFFTVFLKSEEKAEITVYVENPIPGKLTSMIYGSFIEFLLDYINGPCGMYAQEIHNRGFDEPINEKTGIEIWNKLPWCEDLELIQQVFGGFNKNGERYLKLISNDNNKSLGVSQKVWLSENTEYEFYIYHKSEHPPKVFNIKLTDSTFTQVYFKKTFTKFSNEWEKIAFKIPAIDLGFAYLVLEIEGIGELDLDESSLMPINNVFGVRKEFFDLYTKWKPGIIRYPGGCFADLPASKWFNGIGHIDQRKSPNYDWAYFPQRLDFGTDEFLKFCELIGAEPHIVVNFGSGTPEEAANWVEYCNGDINTYYGKLREENGHPEPYNVKYWEVGNEQNLPLSMGYLPPIEMAKRYLEFYFAMKKVDPTIKIMINGEILNAQEFFNKVMDIVGKNVDLYCWHTTSSAPADEISDVDTYLGILSIQNDLPKYIAKLENWIDLRGLYPQVKQAVTEWWVEYNRFWREDIRCNTLEFALGSAVFYNLFAKHPRTIELAERTHNVGLIKSDIDKATGKRVIYGTPTFYVSAMMCNNFGSNVYSTKVLCGSFNTPENRDVWVSENVPWLDVLASGSNDTLYLCVINKHPYLPIKTQLNYSGKTNGLLSNVFELYSPNLIDMNTNDKPENITISEKKWIVDDYYLFPPHSVTILQLQTNPVFHKDNYIDIYPTPLNEFAFVVIRNSESKPSSYTLYDIMGNIVLQNEVHLSDNYFKVDVRQLGKGFYVLKMDFGSEVKFKYLIKN
ncbi:MAG: T9SS type A sorting domain-containing protein, partial [Candidatus Kapabacteria bacterium]|nr:T9SS type A sorting domain-containing protein [Candidatus Kapabacteria bacterium]